MKKFFTALFIILMIASVAILPACKKEEKAAPTFSAYLEGSTLRWSACEGASAYRVHCTLADGSGYTLKVEELSYIAPYTTAGNYVYKVIALDENGAAIAETGSVTYHLGTGEAADPILVGSAEDLLGITETYTLTFGTTKVDSPVYYRLTADIDLSGKKFTPIGTSSKPFKSVLDGAGHTVKGLNITTCTSDGNIGLFGYTKNAVVKNLNLEASLLFNKDSNVSKGELNCGLLIGHSVSTLVDNCHVTGNIEILTGVITTSNYILSAGGIVGKAESGRISGVSYEGDVKAQYGRSYAGGIVGFAQGDSPDFMILNAKAVANVNAVGTSYNLETGTSYSYARAGVLVGNLSYASRLASLVAIGTASASSTKDGTPTTNLTAGVIGRAKSDTSAVTIPMYNIYYSSSIPKVVGTATSLGSYANYIHPLSEEELSDKESYALGNGKYGLDFDEYWTISDLGPSLRKTASEEQPSLTMSVRSEIEGKEFSYDFLLEDLALPTYFDVSVTTTLHALGYNLDTLLDLINCGIPSIYSNDDIEKGVSVKISAPGMDDTVLTTTKTSLHCYLQYGVYSNYEAKPDVFGGFKLINAINSSNVKTVDYSNVKQITITFLPPAATEE